MKPISVEQAGRLIFFDRGGTGNDSGNGRLQLEGTVALHNILARNRFAYLADEVGMGKTYVALGVAGLVRHFNPDARVVVLAPRENIQHKWIKEYRNFVDRNWQVVDNSVRGLDNRPAREQIPCHSLADLARECCLSADQDLFLRMTSFSPQLGGKDSHTQKKGMKRAKERLRAALPQLTRTSLDLRAPDRFRDDYGRLINAVVPPIDLLIVDEAHNYKHGYRRRAALRNHLTALVFGHPSGADEGHPGYGHRVRHLLMLSATPFEHDYADLYNQLDVFGFGDATVKDAAGKRVGKVSMLGDSAVENEAKREVARHFLVRRVTGLRIAGDVHTKNMYRREWRQGGLDVHDEPMEITDPKQRLIVALVQKKVAEVLGSDRFNNRFQIGMLSSFESFLQSATHNWVDLRDETESDDEDAARVFDGEQRDLDDDTRKGIDARPLARLLRSYQRTFGEPLPHPKLDATVEKLKASFENGEKALVFVRRLATMAELAARLNDYYDAWLEGYMRDRLPDLSADVDALFDRYRTEKRGRKAPETSGEDSAAPVQIGEMVYETEEDTSGSETFFAWFFRGKESRGVLSGAAFQKNRLISPSSAYSTLFEDDHVAALLGRPVDVLGQLAAAIQTDRATAAALLKTRAFHIFAGMGRKSDGYPRLYVLEAYQVAALRILTEQSARPELRDNALFVLQEAYPARPELEATVPAGFPDPDNGIGVTTFVTLLMRDAKLSKVLLPRSASLDFVESFREREQRREMLSALSRLGASYIDLYLLAIHQLGSFELSKGGREDAKQPEVELARAFLGLLSQQLDASPEGRPSKPGFHAFRELTAAADAFEDIVSTNFPTIRDEQLWQLRRAFGNVLQNQSPVATSSRSKVKRLVQQFRMPGYPLVLVTTDILQEGEDLHTFCAQVMHYGITWTPSAMEQRTGRVDRIGSLTQRRLDNTDAAHPEQKIQVFYPHLRDTVEVLQVERVLARLNRFIRMVHKNVDVPDLDARQIDAAREMVRDRPDIAPITHRLESAFPVDDAWLENEAQMRDTPSPIVKTELDHFMQVWKHLETALGARKAGVGRTVMGTPTRCTGEVGIREDGIVPHTPGELTYAFELALAPQRAGTNTLLRCIVEIGLLDLDEAWIVDELAELQRRLHSPKICIVQDAKLGKWEVRLEREMLFHPDTTQLDEVETLVRQTLNSAMMMREEFEDSFYVADAKTRQARA